MLQYFHVHPPQQIHDLLAAKHNYQIVLQVTLWQYRAKIFLNILRQYIVVQFGQKMNIIRPVIGEFLEYEEIRKACISCGGCTL